jgi:hypothetical protein
MKDIIASESESMPSAVATTTAYLTHYDLGNSYAQQGYNGNLGNFLSCNEAFVDKVGRLPG